jgi:hypothetical protein
MSVSRKRAFQFVLAWAALAVWYMHFREIDVPKHAARAELHHEIIAKSAPSPYRYRILVPLLAEGGARIGSGALGYDRALLFAYALLEALAIVLAVLVLYSFFANFFEPWEAFLGGVVVVVSMVVALRDHYFQPWSLANALAFALAASLIHAGRIRSLAVLTILAAFNRETSFFIPLFYIALSPGRTERRGRMLVIFLLLSLAWIAAYLLVRLYQGEAPYVHSLAYILRKNLEPRNLFYALMNVTLFMGIFWYFIATGYAMAPSFVKRLSLVALPYLVLLAVFGVWKEVRLLMPLYPILVPMGLSGLRAWMIARTAAG